jgi:hypothetical protein
MERNTSITKSGHTVPTQEFNGRTYRLHKGDKYYTCGTKKLHREVWKFYKGDIPKGYHIHHVDGDKNNNYIENLNLVLDKLHSRFEAKKRHKDNPEWSKDFHAKGIEKAKDWHKSEAGY